ncbi:2-oxoglutarate dehydrogenase complex dihydrolipoyllysine-residue succinyltransferase [Blattabacterium cuenoti]|uniref:2-oxoglutarate dehydrogenase complex dihydrolipoyllysine-residue succinyltransferase n=1 Tax=Blattabacterium cuenoti TaxID=1653831 RepID=UPI00163B660E|nr:2-oxoglutarate dehydrogenase complex dihydrolipoyllysine-residue succinyltransferase [Blattabacterium cuenoti]
MIIKVKVPSPGESITEVEVSSLFVKNGDYVSKGQIIAEIDSDKATLEISAEECGTITLMVKKGERIEVGETFCIINSYKKNDEIYNKNITNTHKVKNGKKKHICNNIASPASKKILNEKNISIKNVKGTGKGGRIIKEDCILFKEKNINDSIIEENTMNNRLKTITPLSSLRRKLSERLVSIKNKTATLTTFNEVDMQEIFLIRKKYKDFFQEKHGVHLGFMSFFTLSCVKALKLYPDINAMIDKEKKINFKYYDISIAISGPKGLMVPVIRNADHLSILEIEKEINRLSIRVRNNTISIDEMKGGTFTITNGGVFGSLLSTPIINPPQSAILGMHKIMERTVVINGSIKIRPMMYLALSYDHRIIDGKESVGFLINIKKIIENPMKFLMEENDKDFSKILDL